MDEDNIDIDDWRRVRLGDEPIYCTAPTPSNPDDIICFGSDEELDDAAKVSKRLRYEAQGLRYLQGKPMLILSASLRGPFDKASGWKNPWLPKQPAVEQSVLKPTQPTAKPFPAIKQRFRKYFEQDDTTPGTDSSMHCHLPSPESNRDVQFFSNTLETDKRSQIQAWAKEVSGGTVLERDDFWAPHQALYDEDTNEPSKKRPAGREWLKTKPSKRKRHNSSQITATASTPTRMPQAGTLTRSTSLPVNVGQTKKRVPSKKMVNHSFQLSTPSSTNQSASEIPFKGQVEASTQCETMLSQDESSISRLVPENSSSLLTSMTAEQIYDQPSPVDGQNSEQVSPAATSSHLSQAAGGTTSEEAQESQGAEETGLESHLDQSFHYRARWQKQTTPVAGPDIPLMEACSKLPRIGTPKPPVHKDAVIGAVAEAEEQRIHIESVAINKGSQHIPDSVREQEIQNKEQSPVSLPLGKEITINGETDNDDDGLSGFKKANDHAITLEVRLSKDEKVSPEHANPMPIGSVCDQIPPKTTDALYIETKVIENKDLDVTHDESHKRHAFLQGSMIRTATSGDSTPVDAHQGKTELSVDGESTLVGDPTDIKGSMPPEISQLPTIHSNPDSPDTKPMPAAELHNTAQNSEENAAQEDESDGLESETDLVIVPLSQLEWGVTEVLDHSAEKPGATSGNEVGNETSKLAVKIEEVPENDVPVRATLLDSPEIVTQQRPCVSDLPSGADLTIEHIKSEPPNDELSHSPYPSYSTLLSSQSGGHRTPRIRASQQSPWGGEGLLGSIRIGQQVQRVTTPTNTTSVHVPFIMGISEERQSPWAATNTSFLPYPKCPHVSPIPTAHGEKLSSPFLQLSIVTTRTNNQLPEHSANGPTTPPRLATSQVRTPDLEKSIKSFAMFNTPSPKRPPRQFIKQHSSTSGLRGILSSAPRWNPWNSRKSSRRVSFASLPNTENDADTLPALNTTKPASPPPQATVNAEDEDIGATFQNHFEVMKRRASGEGIRLRHQPRLLPSSSQQKPMSPAIGAMAEVFQEADAHIVHAQDHTVGDVDEEATDQELAEEQSPWRKESQGVDDVADVMNNLDEFLNAWDVDSELQKARQQPTGGNQRWNMSA
ncbi:hypothetical protein F5Y06DRAFT_255638 [Hypoxylon sp. FL0890]|nr:hypothetical protein F5Y06DRAFT_255638 [Hypoxylon sp. FL0890]